MRSKSLITAISLLLFGCGYSIADDYIKSQGYLHSLDDTVSIWTGIFALNKELDLDTSIYMNYTVDTIKMNSDTASETEGEDDEHEADAASGFNISGFDIMSAASARTGASSNYVKSIVEDTRNEVSFALTRKFGNIIQLELMYDHSKEKDYISKTPSVTLIKELYEKNTTLTLAYSRNNDTVVGYYLTKKETSRTDNYYLGLTQILSPVTVSRVGISASSVSGYISDGNSLVAINGSTVACTVISDDCVLETLPSSRERRSFILGLDHYFIEGNSPLFRDSSVKFVFRYYYDDWGINSATEEIKYYKYLSENLILRLGFRYYLQHSADFAQNDYSSSDRYLTESRQYFAYNYNLSSIKFTYRFNNIPDSQLFSFLNDHELSALYEFFDVSDGTKAFTLMLGLKFNL